MAKVLDMVIVELQELNVSILVPDDYYYVSVDQSGAIYAYEVAPEYNECEGYWVPVSGGGAILICKIAFESDEEKKLCEEVIWAIGEEE